MEATGKQNVNLNAQLGTIVATHPHLQLNRNSISSPPPSLSFVVHPCPSFTRLCESRSSSIYVASHLVKILYLFHFSPLWEISLREQSPSWKEAWLTLINGNVCWRAFLESPENFLAPKSTPKSHLYKHESLILQGCPFIMKILTYNKVSCLETFLFTSNSVNCRAQNRPEKFRGFRAFEKAGTPVLYSLRDRRYTGREGEGGCCRKNETRAWNTDFILLGMDRCLKR